MFSEICHDKSTKLFEKRLRKLIIVFTESKCLSIFQKLVMINQPNCLRMFKKLFMLNVSNCLFCCVFFYFSLRRSVSEHYLRELWKCNMLYATTNSDPTEAQTRDPLAQRPRLYHCANPLHFKSFQKQCMISIIASVLILLIL